MKYPYKMYNKMIKQRIKQNETFDRPRFEKI